ncbi:MupA/Atu3671 family FMN-dependent luciferase-like monooxygenase [Dactylosporangium sp. CA-139066]|uniref:MupA/Atu3671 family FMN-dependent luciferase-like monooxygenase n=1 Tax=Dactylosporangium sp. CA-139066 TaxID=3239930 RepID=UPI003D8A51FA
MAAGGPRAPRLSVFFFASADTGPAAHRYEFVLSAAALADDLGYEAVWVPERHFHTFGGLFPNPAVLAAALAVRTRRIGLRAGSVVLPLHHVARVAEEWAMVDALSNGRAGVSLASGWSRGDFVLAQGPYEQRRERLYASVELLQALWRGEEIEFAAHGTAAPVRTYPAPSRRAIPLWLTAMSGPATFQEAGRRGWNVLTAYLQQDRAQLEANIGEYRRAFKGAAAGGTPHVTLMVHACVADDAAEALQLVERPLLAYQNEFLDLADRTMSADDDGPLTEDEKQELARYAVHKYARERGLIGGPAEVAERLRYFVEIGVDEVACLVDYGLPAPRMLQTLRRLAEVAGRA